MRILQNESVSDSNKANVSYLMHVFLLIYGMLILMCLLEHCSFLVRRKEHFIEKIILFNSLSSHTLDDEFVLSGEKQ